MRDMIFGAAILSWVFVAAHAGTGQVAGLFGLVNATVEHLLIQLG